MNKEQQLQLCSFEQAKALKRLGFDWKCDHFFSGKILLYAFDKVNYRLEDDIYLEEDWSPYSDYNSPDWDWDAIEYVSAPSVALALKWMRDVKGYVADVTYWRQLGNIIYWRHDVDIYDFVCSIDYNTYEQAESALLNELIKLCEKDGK
jgi:hypothetical protein